MGDERRTTVLVPDVCCSAEETSVRKAFKGIADIHSLDFDLTNRTVSFRHHGETGVILETLHQAGFPGRVMSREQPTTSAVPDRNRWSVGISLTLLGLGLALSWSGAASSLPPYVFLLSMVSGGWDIALRCFRAIRALRLDVNVLMTAAAIGAVFLGEYAEGAAVLSLYALSLLLEAMSIDRTRRAIGGLLALTPDTAHVVTSEGEKEVALDRVAVGDTVVIRPGERIPLDGVVTEGETSVDESALTGESLPAFKGIGTTVFAGSINGHGALHVTVSTRAEGTMLHAISDMVTTARQRKGSVQSFMERFAEWYVPFVFILALSVAIIPPLVLGQEFTDWFYRALTLLVISCPCALLLSTPMAVVSAITGAAKSGILIKSGDVLERLSQVQTVAVDKTGTITHGFHDVSEVRSLNGVSEEAIVRIAAALESRSEHPLARAILRYARSHAISLDSRIDGFHSFPGKGVKGNVDGEPYLIGNHAFIEEHGLCSATLEEQILALEKGGATVLILAHAEGAVGLISARDSARSDAAEAIRNIERTTGNPATILTGDNETVGAALAAELGLTSVRSGLLPEDKIREIERLSAEIGPVAMVGDGINDAPALATSHVGFAIGGTGSDAAIDAADVVLLSPSLAQIAPILKLGISAHAIIRFNIFISLLTKVVFLLLGVAGLSSLWLAILADDGITLLVLLNSLRLLGFQRAVSGT